MRLSYDEMEKLRETLYKHWFTDEHINYAIEQIISDEPPHPKTDHFGAYILDYTD